MIAIACPHCDKKLKVKEELAGKKLKCPGCGGAVAVPADGASASAPTAKGPSKTMAPAAAERT